MALVTTAGSASANSYGDADGATAYFLQTGRQAEWDAAVAGLPESWLLRAMPFVEANDYIGTCATTTQALQFPRVGSVQGQRMLQVSGLSSTYGLYDLRGRFFASNAIPTPVIQAQYEQAFALATNTNWSNDRYEAQTVAAGDTSIQVRNSRQLGKLCKLAMLQLDGLLLSGGSVRRLVRA